MEAQLEVTRKYAADKGFEVVQEFREVESAKSAGRPRFKEMLKIVRAGKASAIIVEKVDRLTRNFVDFGTLESLGVTLHFAKEGGNPLSPESPSQDRLMFGLKVLIAKSYIDNLQEEIKKGTRTKARLGLWPTVAPIGYLNVTRDGVKIIVPDPERAPIVRKMFERYAKGGCSLKDIQVYATMLGLTSRRGNPPGAKTIQNILENPLYTGIVEWNGQEVPGKHEPIISLELYKAAQRVMQGRSVASAGKGGHFYAYAGLITCSDCGCAASPYKAKGKYVYYACTGARGCKRTGLREDVIDAQIASLFDRLIIPEARFDQLREALRSLHSEQSREHEEALQAITRRRDDLKRRLEQLYLDRLDGRSKVHDDIYCKFSREWGEALDAANEEIAAHDRAARATWEDNLNLLSMLSNSSNRFKIANSARRREIAKNMLSNFSMAQGNLALELRPSFKLVAMANAEDLENPDQKALSGLWWRQGDSNP